VLRSIHGVDPCRAPSTARAGRGRRNDSSRRAALGDGTGRCSVTCGQIGRLHEEQARLEARRRRNETVAQILEAEELTREEYDQLILIISIDAETREAFEKILAELREGRVGAPAS